jgi:hypothetical protein
MAERRRRPDRRGAVDDLDTNSARAVSAAFLLPLNVRVTLTWLPGERIGAREGPKAPDSRRAIEAGASHGFGVVHRIGWLDQDETMSPRSEGATFGK